MTPRVTKSEQEKAAERVGVLERRLRKLNVKLDLLKAQAVSASREIGDVEALLEYARANPALKTAPTLAAS